MKLSKSHLLILLVAVLLSACDSGGGSGEQSKSQVKDGISGLVSDINKEVVTDIRKSFPLPDQYSTLNHHNDVLNFTTPMSVEDVVAFYRQGVRETRFHRDRGERESREFSRDRLVSLFSPRAL